MSSSRSTRRAALRLRRGRELAEQQQRRDAVLVPHVLGVDAVAERLLVAERQPVDPADPLEAGERLGVRLAGRRGHLPEQAGRDDRWRRRCPACRAREQGVGEQRADLVAAQHPPAVRAGDGGGAPVGVGVVGDHEVGAASSASAIARSIAPGSSGFGNATVGKSGSGCSCCSTTARRGEAGGLEHLLDRRAADAVQRRVDDVEVARAVAGEARRRCRGSGRRGPRRAPSRRRRAGTSASGADRGDPARRSRRRRAARSGCRRRGRPCSRCPAAGCGSR